jgi:hypothetical protein
MDAYFGEFKFRTHELVEKMAVCENCINGKDCPAHVFEMVKGVQKNKFDGDEGYYKVKELIETNTHDKLKEHI